MHLGRSIIKLRYSVARYIRKIAAFIAPHGNTHGITYPNLGAERLPKNAPRALIIYSATGIDRYVRGVPLSDPIFNKHTIYWESVRMVQILNDAGYIVDYCDVWKPFSVDWKRYAIVIDNLNNLKDIPKELPIKKVYWATNNHWLVWNAGELQRIAWFKERTGITMPMTRQMPNIFSDEHADFLTYFGTQQQIDSFSSHPAKVQINISSCATPPRREKNLATARNKYLWISGGGALHKGLNLAMEAFARMPEKHLYIVADMQDKNEPQFYKWAKPFMERHQNIHEMGWYDLTSDAFNELADQCIGVLYLSSSCGGPGATARVLHNGLVPIVTPTGFVRAEHLGYVVPNDSAESIIAGVQKSIADISALDDISLVKKSNAVRDFAAAHHTREAFSKSFADLIRILQ